MEDELWRKIYRKVIELGKGSKPKGGTYTDADVTLTFLWGVLHDRPSSWACVRRNWPLHLRRRPLPSASQLSRRLRTKEVCELLRQTEGSWRPAAPQRRRCFWIDGKSLPIGGASGDREAGFGPAAGSTMAKGYKLHAVTSKSQGFCVWEVEPMNISERTVARKLIDQLEGPGSLAGDAHYDANPLYEAAGNRGLQLVAPPQRTGKGHGHRRQSPFRLQGLKLVKTPHGKRLLHARDAADRLFGELTTPGGGLGPLPAWVRGLARVRRWVQGKIIIFHIRRYLRNTRAT
jgi:hypothetical protein